MAQSRMVSRRATKQIINMEGTWTNEVTKQQLRTRTIIRVACWAPLLSGIGYVAYVKLKLRRSSHRSFNPTDMYYMRTMDGSVPQIIENPGIRIEPSFLSDSEQNQLRFDSKVLISHYGYSVIPFYVRPNFTKQVSQLKSNTKVNAYKVTGRDPDTSGLSVNRTEQAEQLRKEQEAIIIKTNPWESNEPTPAPWNVGHSFDLKQLPPSYQNLIERIKKLRGYALGSVRDVSIDFREEGYFRLDPQIHPMQDGVTVFMLTLESDSVITMIPNEKEQHRRSQIEDISRLSWTDKDIDILHKRGDLLCITDKARNDLNYAIRQGLDGKIENLKKLRKSQMLKLRDTSDSTKNSSIEDENEREMRSSFRKRFESIRNPTEYFNYENLFMAGNLDSLEQYNPTYEKYCLCDWWGTTDNVVPRCKEKILITISFGRPT